MMLGLLAAMCLGQAVMAVPAQAGLDGQGPIVALSPTRGETVLNGIWEFRPAAGDWGRCRVPGDWSSGRPGRINEGAPASWSGIDFGKLAKAEYRRTLTVPADWKGRKVQLDFARVSTDATVFLDSKKIGEIHWPGGAVDLTENVRWGEPQELRVEVLAASDETERLVLMGVNQISTESARLDSRGLTDDVVLTSRPTDRWIEDVFVKPSFRTKSVELEVELGGTLGTAPLRATVEMVRDGNVELMWEETVPPQKSLRLRHAWPNPKLWDLGQPNLYTARVKLVGEGIDDEYAQRFGFRELHIEGRKFYLNGKEFRMRPALGAHQWSNVNGQRELIEAQIDGMRRFGYNIEEFWPFNHNERGSWHFRHHWATVADEKGWPVMGNAPSVADVIFTWTTPNWTQPGVKEAWFERARREIKRYRNHPSILLWTSSGNTFGQGEDQDPRRIGQNLQNPIWKSETPSWWDHQRLGIEAKDMIRKLDPTRPLFYHQGTNGDVYAVNNYLCFIPLQEREEWLSEWSKTGDLPYMAVEFGTPLDCSFFRGRNGFGNNMASEPLITEFAAIYLGPDAARKESDAYRREIADRFIGGQAYKHWHNNSPALEQDTMQEIQKLFVRNTWRAWRSYGITGGMVPWSDAHAFGQGDYTPVAMPPFKPGRRGTYTPTAEKRYTKWLDPDGVKFRPAAEALREAIQPQMAYIGGAPEFVDKKAHYRVGEKLTKQAVLINDGREPIAVSGRWGLYRGETLLTGGSFRRTVGVASTEFVPINTVLSRSPGNRPEQLLLRLSVKMEGQNVPYLDTFPITVYGNSSPPRREVTVWDPVGKTRAMLQGIGYRVRDWKGEKANSLVVGSEAFSTKEDPRLDAFVRGGGRLLVMSQRREWLEGRAGFRTSQHVARRVFPVPGAPFLKGSRGFASNLKNWNGSGTLLNLKPSYGPKDFAPTQAPKWGWRWGNRHSIASVMVESPHLSGWRPLFQADFGLAYTPLMELDLGKGRVTLCQFDFEDQARVDPEAEQLMREVLERVEKEPLKASRRIVFDGDLATKRELVALGIPIATVKPTAADLLVTTQATPAPGLTTLVLRQPQGTLRPGLIPVTRLGTAETLGLGLMDVRTRAPFLTDQPNPAPLFTFGKRTSGRWVQMNHLPWLLDADKWTYHRLTRWRWSRALCQVVANLGGRLPGDERFLRPRSDPIEQVGLSGGWSIQVTQRLPSIADVAKAYPDPGISPSASGLLRAPTGVWQPVRQPIAQAMSDFDGEAVLQRVFELPVGWKGQDLELSLGALDDFDTTTVNGVVVGSVDAKTPEWWGYRRVYRVPAKLLRPGKNRIAIRIWDRFGGGGLNGPIDTMFLRSKVPPRRVYHYHPDYRSDFELGDDPFRYYRW